MDFKQALRMAVKGKSCCFLGAGFSYHAKNHCNDYFPSADGLTSILKKELNNPTDGTLKEISQDYIDEHGKELLYRKINDVFNTKSTEEDYTSFANIRWKSIYTTNYDNLVEWVHRKIDKKIHSFKITDSPSLRNLSEQNCIHLNGYIEKISLQEFNAEFRLTETSYLTNIFNNSTWKTAFNIDLRESQSIFFIGYSLYDIEIESCLIESDELKEKTFFIVEEKPNTRLLNKISKYGTVINIGVANFINELKQAIIDWSSEEQEFEYNSIQRMTANLALDKYGTNDLIELLMNGNINKKIVKHEILNKINNYYVCRSEIKEIPYSLRDNNCLIVHAKLANGKTAFIQGAAEFLEGEGYTCFELIDGKTITTQEIENLRKLKRPVLFIENYHRSFETIRIINTVSSDSIKLILTSRTELHEIFVDDLGALLTTYDEINLNNIRSIDVDEIIKLLETNGLFGELSSLTSYNKKKTIQTKFRSEFSQILADVLKAPQINSRVSSLLDSIQDNYGFEEVVVLACIGSLLSFELDDLDINTISASVKFGRTRQLRDQALSQLIEKEGNGYIRIKNPVLARIILEHISKNNPKKLMEYLIKFYTNIDRNIKLELKYDGLLKDLNVYSNLFKIFGMSNVDLIDSFYDAVKVYNGNKSHPHFWLQWAITKLSLKKYDQAESFFKTAYSLAGVKNKYNHDWVNCQYARLLIETAPSLIQGKKMIERIERAHSLIIGQTNRHYPFRVAIQYFSFFEEVQSTLNDDEKSRLKLMATEFYEKIPRTLSTMNNPDHPVINEFTKKYKILTAKI